MRQRYILLFSDCFDTDIVRYEDYMVIRSNMSSGDFGTHIALDWIGPTDDVLEFFDDDISEAGVVQ